MKKIIIASILLVFSLYSNAQTVDYRTSEDGLNKLFNNPDFITDVLSLSEEDLTLDKLDGYLSKYVPEYNDYKITNDIDPNKLFFANSGNVSTDFLLGQLGDLLDLNMTETQDIMNVLTGNVNIPEMDLLSSEYGDLLFEKSNNVGVDYAIDFAVDFFAGELGSNEVNSELIDMGGDLLGGFFAQRDQLGQPQISEEDKLYDYSIYSMGVFSRFDKATQKDVTNIRTGQEDLYLHFQANKKIPNNIHLPIETINYDEAIKLFNEVIVLYKKKPERAAYLYLAYTSRGQCKMQQGAYRAAIIDYYFAQEILESILNGKLPDNMGETHYPKGFLDVNNKATYLKGAIETRIGHFTHKDLVITLTNRAFAKYRAGDFTGAIADCKLGTDILVSKKITVSGKPNDYKDILQAIIAMSQFGLGDYKSSYTTFSNANLTDDIIGDKDKDGLCNFLDMDKEGAPGALDVVEGLKTMEYYGVPNYFPFDITQIKGLCYYKANKNQDAIDTYENLVNSETGFGLKMFTRVGADISAVYSTLGSFYYALGDKTKSIALLDSAIQLNPYQLDYYFKRGTYKKEIGQIEESKADLNIVKDPQSLLGVKKNKDYYYTRHTNFISAANHTEVYNILKEALTAYPEEVGFFNLAMSHLLTSKSKLEAKELANLVKAQAKKYHLLLSLHYEFSANMEDAETEMQLAFDNGLGFYECGMPYRLKLQEKSYYSRLFMKYGNRTNNNFIALDFDKEKTTAMLDSIYAPMQANTTGLMKKFIKIGCDIASAKLLGNYEEYLKLIDKNKSYSKLFANYALDKIECLVILGKKKEAHDFAVKIIASNEFTISQGDETSRIAIIAIQGFANNPYK